MMRKYFYNKYISWTLSILAIISIVSYETFNSSLCFFYSSVILICVYSFGFYVYEGIESQFRDIIVKYQIAVSLISGLVFINFFINCLQ